MFRKVNYILILILLLTSVSFSQMRQPETILPDKLINDLINELSGSLALNHIIELGAYNRDRLQDEYGGKFWESEYMEKMAKYYGLSDVHIEHLERMSLMGAQQWDAEIGELWLAGSEEKLIISYRDEPTCLATGSASTDVTADLIFVGDGTKDKDYENIDVSGKVVLATGAGGSWSSATSMVYANAVKKRGALGVVVFKNLKPFDYPNQIPWAGITNFFSREVPKEGTFGFNLPHKTGYQLMERLLKGDKLKVRVKIKTMMFDADEEVTTAVIPGKSDEEIVVVAHLFEGISKQGAIDNFSGCAAILDAARAIAKLIRDGKLPQPERTIRFLWVPEITGTYLYMQKYPEEVKRMLCAINLDMVGENMVKGMNALRLYRSFGAFSGYLSDICQEFYEYVGKTNSDLSFDFSRPILDVRGTDHPFRYSIEPYGGGSDHIVFQMPMFKIPAVMFINWPDPFYHSNLDRAVQADPTQLKRVAFITAASGVTIAYAKPDDVLKLGTMMLGKSLERIAADIKKFSAGLLKSSGDNLFANFKEAKIGIEEAYKREKMSLGSLDVFAEENKDAVAVINNLQKSLEKGLNGHLNSIDEIYGMMCDKYEKKSQKIKLTDAEKRAEKMIPEITIDENTNIMQLFFGAGKIKGNAGSELLNYCNGERTILDLRNAVSAEYNPLKTEQVIEHFEILEKSGWVKIIRK